MTSTNNIMRAAPTPSIPTVTPEQNLEIQKLAWQILNWASPLEGAVTLMDRGKPWGLILNSNRKTIQFPEKAQRASLSLLVEAAKVIAAIRPDYGVVEMSELVLTKADVLYCVRQAPSLNWLVRPETFDTEDWPKDIFYIDDESGRGTVAVSEATLRSAFPKIWERREELSSPDLREILANDPNLLFCLLTNREAGVIDALRTYPVENAKFVVEHNLTRWYSLCYKLLDSSKDCVVTDGVAFTGNPSVFALLEKLQPSVACISCQRWEEPALPHVKAYVLDIKPDPALFPDFVTLSPRRGYGHLVIRKSAIPTNCPLQDLIERNLDHHFNLTIPCLSEVPAEAWARALLFPGEVPRHGDANFFIDIATMLAYMGKSDSIKPYDEAIVNEASKREPDSAYAFMDMVKGVASLPLPASRHYFAQKGAEVLEKLKALSGKTVPGLPSAEEFQACMAEAASIAERAKTNTENSWRQGCIHD